MVAFCRGAPREISFHRHGPHSDVDRPRSRCDGRRTIRAFRRKIRLVFLASRPRGTVGSCLAGLVLGWILPLNILPNTPNFRLCLPKPRLIRYSSDASLRLPAGRTNVKVNLAFAVLLSIAVMALLKTPPLQAPSLDSYDGIESVGGLMHYLLGEALHILFPAEYSSVTICLGCSNWLSQ